jgi:hypothetical protein
VSPGFTVLLVAAIVTMIALVILLVRLNGRNLAKQTARQAAAVGLKPRSGSAGLDDLGWLWKRTDIRRTALGLCEGQRDGWNVRTFTFAHDPDAVTQGARVFTRLFAHNLMSFTSLATDSRTAQRRAVLIAVKHDAMSLSFKVRGRQLMARDSRTRAIIGGRRSVRLRTWAPPARITLHDGWLFLESFYILPKWLGRYVQASTETCDFLGSAGVLGRRQDSGSPVGPLF